MGCPGLQQGCIHGEVLIAEQRFDLRCPRQLLKKATHDLLVQQPLPVFSERDGVPDRIIRAEAFKQAEKQVVVELLQ